MVLFLHGIGERGTDNQAQLVNEVELFNNEKSRDGTLLDREIIISSEVSPGNRDSGTLGVANLNNVVGKVELLK